MTILLTILHIIVCLMLIVVILVQGGRGQGLSGPSFSSGNVQSLFGTQAADFLTKATSVSAILFLFTCIGLNFFETRKSKSLLRGAAQTAPVDIDAVKKALEKIKAEKGTASDKAKAEVASLVDTTQKSAQETSGSAVKAADGLKAAANSAVEDAGQKTSAVAAEAQKSAAQAADTLKKEAPKVEFFS